MTSDIKSDIVFGHRASQRSWLGGRSRGCEFDPGTVPYFGGGDFYGHYPPSAYSRKVVVRYKRKYVHKVLVILFVKLFQEKKVWICELTVST